MRCAQWVALLCLAAGVVACQTPYQSSGLGGGYDDQDLGDGQYHISVRGNAYTPVGTVEEYFYRRAQELARAHGFTSYRVIQIQSGIEPWALGARPMAWGIVQFTNEASSDASASAKSGSGFFVNTRGDALTNYHVVEGCTQISISGPIPAMQASIEAFDSQDDLAVLRPTSALTANPAQIRGGPSARPGDSIVAIGYPLQGLLAPQQNVTTGTVSAAAGIGNDTRYLQITAPVQPGNSGGPLLDMGGAVVGVVSAKLDTLKVASVTGDIPENVNFAIKSQILRSFLDSQNVTYSTMPSAAPMSAADVAAAVRSSVVFVACR